MIEIILREDVSKYETKPFFGFTYRQAGAIALSAGMAFAVFYFGTKVGIPIDILGFLIVALGALIAVAFLVKVQGMYGNKRIPILMKYRKRPKTCFSQNLVFDKEKEEEILKSKKEIKKENAQKEKELKIAAAETEFVNDDGGCLSEKEINKKRKKQRNK